MKTITATSARAALFSLIKDASEAHHTYHITSRAGEAVLMSKEDFESLVETLELLSTKEVLKGVRRAKKDIAAGRTSSLEDVFGA